MPKCSASATPGRSDQPPAAGRAARRSSSRRPATRGRERHGREAVAPEGDRQRRHHHRGHQRAGQRDRERRRRPSASRVRTAPLWSPPAPASWQARRVTVPADSRDALVAELGEEDRVCWVRYAGHGPPGVARLARRCALPGLRRRRAAAAGLDGRRPGRGLHAQQGHRRPAADLGRARVPSYARRTSGGRRPRRPWSRARLNVPDLATAADRWAGRARPPDRADRRRRRVGANAGFTPSSRRERRQAARADSATDSTRSANVRSRRLGGSVTCARAEVGGSGRDGDLADGDRLDPAGDVAAGGTPASASTRPDSAEGRPISSPWLIS